MSKKTKKRNKQYQGEDAKVTTQGPTVTRYKAVVRSPLGEWWHDHKRAVKLTAGIGGGAIVIGWLLVEAFLLIF